MAKVLTPLGLYMVAPDINRKSISCSRKMMVSKVGSNEI